MLTEGAQVNGTTLGATDDYNFKNTDCTGAFTTGPDVAYAFTASTTNTYTFTLTPNGWDAALYVIQDCASAGTGMTLCVGGADAAGAGGQETVTLSLTGGETYFIIVDSFGASSGDFTLVAGQPTASRCQSAAPLALTQLGDSVTFSDVTSGASGNDSLTCGGLGPELAYTFQNAVPARLQVHVQSLLQPDGGGMIPVVYVQKPCGLEQAEASCFGANVPGDAADLDINNLPPTGPYTLWIDSRSGTEGAFTATATLSAPAPPPANDNCEGTVPLISLNTLADGGFFGSAPYDSRLGDSTVTEPGVGTCIAGYEDGPDVVFAVNVAQPVPQLTISATGGGTNGSFQSLFLRSGPTCQDSESVDGGVGTSVACEDFPPLVTGPLTPGVYYLWIEGPGQGTVSISSP